MELGVQLVHYFVSLSINHPPPTDLAVRRGAPGKHLHTEKEV